jgi:hypothetical protein
MLSRRTKNSPVLMGEPGGCTSGGGVCGGGRSVGRVCARVRTLLVGASKNNLLMSPLLLLLLLLRVVRCGQDLCC